MTAYLIVLGVLGWLVVALLSVAVVACAGRAGRDEDVQRGLASDLDLAAQARSCNGVPRAS